MLRKVFTNYATIHKRLFISTRKDAAVLSCVTIVFPPFFKSRQCFDFQNLATKTTLDQDGTF